jgi:hypothetical protein
MSALTDQEDLVKSYLTDNLWKLLGDDSFADDFRILTRKIEGVPYDSLDAAIRYLNKQASFVTPIIEGKQYPDTWYQGHVWWERSTRKPDDATVTLTQLLVTGQGKYWSFATAGIGGTVTTTVFRDLTKDAYDSLRATACTTATRNSSSQSWDRDTNRWSGSLTSHIQDAEADASFYDKGWFKELVVDFRWNHGES